MEDAEDLLLFLVGTSPSAGPLRERLCLLVAGDGDRERLVDMVETDADDAEEDLLRRDVL